jgi:hypothetical protein
MRDETARGVITRKCGFVVVDDNNQGQGGYTNVWAYTNTKICLHKGQGRKARLETGVGTLRN